MFERFTERARRVVVLAQEESRGLSHNYIGTEHILLGLLREDEGLAARVLESLGMTLERAREEVVRIVRTGEEPTTGGQIPFTPRAKRTLELALREALSLGHDYIGTEHILLGLVRQREGVATRVIAEFGTDEDAIHAAVVRMLPRRRARAAEESPGPSPSRSPEQVDDVGHPEASRGEHRPTARLVPADGPLDWRRARLMWRPEGLEIRVPQRLGDGAMAAFAADEVWMNPMLSRLRREIWRGWLGLASPTLLEDVEPEELRRLLDAAAARATSGSMHDDQAETFLRRLRQER